MGKIIDRSMMEADVILRVNSMVKKRTCHDDKAGVKLSLHDEQATIEKGSRLC